MTAVYSARFTTRLATRIAVVPAASFHAEMTPSSLTKMNAAGPDSSIAKSLVRLTAMPVGEPPVIVKSDGILTTSGCAAPVAVCNVDVPVALFADQSIPVESKLSPHGFTRLASMCAAC